MEAEVLGRKEVTEGAPPGSFLGSFLSCPDEICWQSAPARSPNTVLWPAFFFFSFVCDVFVSGPQRASLLMRSDPRAGLSSDVPFISWPCCCLAYLSGVLTKSSRGLSSAVSFFYHQQSMSDISMDGETPTECPQLLEQRCEWQEKIPPLSLEATSSCPEGGGFITPIFFPLVIRLPVLFAVIKCSNSSLKPSQHCLSRSLSCGCEFPCSAVHWAQLFPLTSPPCAALSFQNPLFPTFLQRCPRVATLVKMESTSCFHTAWCVL